MKIGTFFLGIITGIALIFFLGIIENDKTKYNNPYNIEGLSLLPEKGSCITSSDIIIFQTLEKGIALATSIREYNRIFLLINNSGKLFYDDEKIKMPPNQCAKQIGVYSYQTREQIQKTVPVVIIE